MSSVNDLQAIVGAEHVRDAESIDAIDAVQPRWVVRPGTLEEVSAVLAHADGSGLRVVARGAGTQLGVGNPPSGVDVVLDMSRFDQILEHATGDLVLSVEAGVSAGRLVSALGSAGQMLALDVPSEQATIGGIIAANPSGPRRFRYGTVRDLLIGVTIVLADGTIARAGGKVVKNVAGYDLSKLMSGSLGTLAVIVRANFRLHPSPNHRRLVEFELDGPEAIGPAVQRVLHSPVVPSAVQLRWPRDGTPRLGILFEGVEPSVVSQAEAVIGLVAASSASPLQQVGADEQRWRDFVVPPADGSDVVIKVTTLPASLSETAALILRATKRLRGGVHLSGAVGTGIIDAYLDASEPKAVAEVLGEIRTGLRSGSAVVTRAPLEVKRMVDVWGPAGSSLELMRRVKQRFDPRGTLNPGRFVGGI